MSLKDTVAERLEEARMRVQEFRGRYFSVSARVVEHGSDRLSGLTRLTSILAPGLRENVNQRISDLQSWLDDLNQSLAEKAIPDDRRARVGRLADQSRSRRPLRVVQGGQAASRSAASAAGASKSASKSASGKQGTKTSANTGSASGGSGSSKASGKKNSGQTAKQGTGATKTGGKKNTGQRKSSSAGTTSKSRRKPAGSTTSKSGKASSTKAGKASSTQSGKGPSTETSGGS